MIVTFTDGRMARGEMNGNGGPCYTVARAADVLRFRRRSGQAVVLFPYAKRDRHYPDNVERHDPDTIAQLEAETPEEAAPGRRREPRALAVWRLEDEPAEDDDAPRADWTRALPTGGWA